MRQSFPDCKLVGLSSEETEGVTAIRCQRQAGLPQSDFGIPAHSISETRAEDGLCWVLGTC